MAVVLIIFGSNDDLRDFMTKPGRTPASVSKIEDAGHMVSLWTHNIRIDPLKVIQVIQQQPEKCAEEILSILLIESKRMARL